LPTLLLLALRLGWCCRVREPAADWSAALARAQPPEGPEARFRVERLTVVESTLSPQGSIYNVRLEAPLTA